jgi:hypothetical protein
MKDLKVLARRGADPYGLETQVFHEAGQWLAEQAHELGFAHKVLHLRGIHYAIVAASGVIKPNGTPSRRLIRSLTWRRKSWLRRVSP